MIERCFCKMLFLLRGFASRNIANLVNSSSPEAGAEAVNPLLTLPRMVNCAIPPLGAVTKERRGLTSHI